MGFGRYWLTEHCTFHAISIFSILLLYLRYLAPIIHRYLNTKING